jgi:hypothetical protein
MTPLDSLYATDEDIAVYAPSDFALLCPRDQTLARGGDGSFSPSDRWTLQSASVDFVARGLKPGHVVQLLGPPSTYPVPGDALVVTAVAAGSVTLRRKGQAAGIGQPPGPEAGASGVEFLVSTFAPQIEAACYDLDQRFGIDSRLPGRSRADLADPRELREATVLTVLHRRYVDLSRDAEGPLSVKAALLRSELDRVLARTALHWLSPAVEAATTRFGTRISR